MRQNILIGVFACMLAAMVGAAIYAAEKKGSEKPTTQPAATQASTQSAAPINKFCAVETENPVDPTVPTVTYKGKVIGFCCEDCVPKFKKNPEAYMKDLK